MSVSRPGRAAATKPMFLMGVMMGGACSVDTITANLLPITAKHFTDNLALIGLMVALNRIAGFFVQPYAAWKSDGHFGAQGRRRPFLLAAWPATLVSVGLLGALPFLVPLEYQRTAAVVALLFAINLVMQVALDVAYGTGTPLYGDTFAPGTLSRANAVRSLIASVVLGCMMAVAVPLAEYGEFMPYVVAMGFISISWSIAQFGLRENIPARLPLRGSYHPFVPLGELRAPYTRSVAFIAAAVLVSAALSEMFHALFVTETLGLPLSVLGWSATAGIIVSFLAAYPVGVIADRCGARRILVIGFALLVAVELAFVLWVRDVTSLYAAIIVLRMARVMVQIPVMALIFQHAPAERRGSIFASVQMTRSGLAGAATVVVGMIAAQMGSYRVCYAAAALVGVLGLVAAARLVTPPREAQASQ